MEYFIGGIIGIIVGAVVMFFVYKNNKNKIEAKWEDLMHKEVAVRMDIKNEYNKLEEKYFDTVKDLQDKYDSVKNDVEDVYKSLPTEFEKKYEDVVKKIKEIINH